MYKIHHQDCTLPVGNSGCEQRWELLKRNPCLKRPRILPIVHRSTGSAMSLTEKLASSIVFSGWLLSLAIVFRDSSTESNLTDPTFRLVVVLAFLGLATLLSRNIWAQWREEQVEIICTYWKCTKHFFKYSVECWSKGWRNVWRMMLKKTKTKTMTKTSHYGKDGKTTTWRGRRP